MLAWRPMAHASDSPPFNFALGLCATWMLSGCSGEPQARVDAATVDAPPSPACLQANDHSDFAWISANILTPSCANFGACHRGAAAQAGGLSLEAGVAHGALVGKPSKLFPNYMLVAPNDPAMSYLLVIMGHVDGPLNQKAGTMPYNAPLLCVEKRRAIELWISAGAKND